MGPVALSVLRQCDFGGPVSMFVVGKVQLLSFVCFEDVGILCGLVLRVFLPGAMWFSAGCV